MLGRTQDHLAISRANTGETVSTARIRGKKEIVKTYIQLGSSLQQGHRIGPKVAADYNLVCIPTKSDGGRVSGETTSAI